MKFGRIRTALKDNVPYKDVEDAEETKDEDVALPEYHEEEDVVEVDESTEEDVLDPECPEFDELQFEEYKEIVLQQLLKEKEAKKLQEPVEFEELQVEEYKEMVLQLLLQKKEKTVAASGA